MFLIIYLAGVFFMIMSVVMTIADSRVLYLSDALRFLALALASWAGLLFLFVEIIADHVEDKHGNIKIFDFRRKRKRVNMCKWLYTVGKQRDSFGVHIAHNFAHIVCN